MVQIYTRRAWKGLFYTVPRETVPRNSAKWNIEQKRNPLAQIDTGTQKHTNINKSGSMPLLA